MHSNAYCGDGYCGPMGFYGSKEDKVALLEEQEKVMEAKLATIRHMKESAKSAQEK